MEGALEGASSRFLPALVSMASPYHVQPRLARLPGNPRAAQSASSLLSIAPFDSRPHKSATTPPPERSARRQQSLNTEKLRATRTFEHFQGRVLWKPDAGVHPSAAALIAARRLFVHSQHVSRGKAAGQSPLYARNPEPGPVDVAASDRAPLSRVASAPAIRPTTLLQSVLLPGANTSAPWVVPPPPPHRVAPAAAASSAAERPARASGRGARPWSASLGAQRRAEGLGSRRPASATAAVPLNTGVPRERRSDEIEIERRSSATSTALADANADAEVDADADADADAEADADAHVDWRALADWRLAERSPAVEPRVAVNHRSQAVEPRVTVDSMPVNSMHINNSSGTAVSGHTLRAASGRAVDETDDTDEATLRAASGRAAAAAVAFAEGRLSKAELDVDEARLAEVLGDVSPGTNLTNLIEIAEARLAEIRSRREAQAALHLARSDLARSDLARVDATHQGVMASRRIYGRPTGRVLSEWTPLISSLLRYPASGHP